MPSRWYRTSRRTGPRPPRCRHAWLWWPGSSWENRRQSTNEGPGAAHEDHLDGWLAVYVHAESVVAGRGATVAGPAHATLSRRVDRDLCGCVARAALHHTAVSRVQAALRNGMYALATLMSQAEGRACSSL